MARFSRVGEWMGGWVCSRKCVLSFSVNFSENFHHPGRNFEILSLEDVGLYVKFMIFMDIYNQI